jgi:hypothetical protein|tara:strand:- start:10075 stop:10431 length:357 start_codon:yes stop_codon:yes gene_type:complete
MQVQKIIALLFVPFISGCAALTKSGIIGGAAGAGALAGSLASGGLLAPAAGAVITGGISTLAMTAGNSGQCIDAAPDTIWTVAQKAVELGGIGLILALVIVPAIAGWLMPGPTRLNRK